MQNDYPLIVTGQGAYLQTYTPLREEAMQRGALAKRTAERVDRDRNARREFSRKLSIAADRMLRDVLRSQSK